MILTKQIKITINRGNKGIYRKLDNNVQNGDIIYIKPEQLSKNSQMKIEAKCDVCGFIKETSYQSYLNNYEKHKLYTCKKCSRIKCEKTCMEKYGVDNYGKTEESKEKVRKTNIEKFGVDNPMKNKEIKEKVTETNISKYGYKYTLQNKEIREKSKKTMLEKFGVDNISKSKYWKEKVKKTSMEKWNVDYYSKTKESKEKTIIKNLEKYGYLYHNQDPKRKEKFSNSVKNGVMNSNKMKKYIEENKILSFDGKEYIIFCEHCKENFIISYTLLKNRKKHKTTICTNCNPNSSSKSGLEIQVLNFIKDNYDGEVIHNSRSIISPYELDIYIPEFKTAIEFNGLWWHNEINKPDDYHKLKSDICYENGIRLIHVWEDDWKSKRNIIESIILGVIKGYEKLENCRVDYVEDYRNFCVENSVYGYIKSDFCLGLYKDEELISILSYNEGDKINITNFCDNGFEILLNHIKKSNKVVELELERSYIDSFKFVDLGFKIEYFTEPDFYYIINENRINSKFIKDFDELIGIYDSGKVKLSF